MPIGGKLYSWNEENVNRAPASSGVYAFYDEHRELIYIGRSTNIRERFQGYWNSNFEEDPCKRATRSYRREVTDNHETREAELLDEYRRTHGRLPRCNERGP